VRTLRRTQAASGNAAEVQAMIVSEEPMPVLIERVSGVSPEQGTVAQAYANPTPANITAEHKLLTVSAPKQERNDLFLRIARGGGRHGPWMIPPRTIMIMVWATVRLALFS
jgi:hypothetical protein